MGRRSRRCASSWRGAMKESRLSSRRQQPSDAPLMRRIATLLAFVVTLATAALPAATTHFYSDDPIAREPERQNASAAQPEDIGLAYELGHNLFVVANHVPSGTRAQ